MPVLFLILGLTLFISRRIRFNAARYLGLFLLVFSGLGLVHMRVPMETMLDNVEQHGGYIGFISSVLLRLFISDIGAKAVLIIVLLISILITFELSFRRIFSWFIPDRKIGRMPSNRPLNLRAHPNSTL